MTPAIHGEHITVRYGRRTAIDDVTLSIASGSLYALLGRNGAGKSSLVRCLLGQFRPEKGRIEVSVKMCGSTASASWSGWESYRRIRMRRRACVCATWHISHRASISASEVAFDERIARFGIAAGARFGDLSKGQKKQVSLALALAASPELVILDDPTLGLDVVARRSLFEEVIADVSDRGLTVLITTHDLSPIERIADRVGVLREGEIVLDEEVEALKSRFRRIRFLSPLMPLSAANFTPLSTRSWGRGTEAVISNYDELAFERMREAAKVPVVDVSPMTLEEIFIAVTGERSGGGR